MSKLKEARQEKQMSKEELGFKVGITVRYIDFLEAGLRKPSLDVAFAIARELDKKVDDIFLPSECTKCS